LDYGYPLVLSFDLYSSNFYWRLGLITKEVPISRRKDLKAALGALSGV
jgi:hypothetical protein